MKSEDIEILENYIKLGEYPILIEEFPESLLKDGVILESNCETSILTGHFDGAEYLPPEWYNELVEKSKNQHCLLVIKDINKIPAIEQIRFKEILKKKRVKEFELPKNCAIIATCSNLGENPITEEIYSLFVHI